MEHYGDGIPTDLLFRQRASSDEGPRHIEFACFGSSEQELGEPLSRLQDSSASHVSCNQFRAGLGLSPVHSSDTSLESNFANDFITSRGNEYFCDIDEEYLTDRFNLTGLQQEVSYYQHALDLVTDVFDVDCDDDQREQIERSARHLYGLVHARYIVTTRGLQKMMAKYKDGDFGKCPRYHCAGRPLLPHGLSDLPNQTTVKLYCARCEDLYNPKSSRHASIDAAYFGTSFHSIFFQVYPHLLPQKSQKRYEPRVYGFRVHAAAALSRWQAEERDRLKERLESQGVETGFEAEDEEIMRLEDEEEEQGRGENGREGIDDMFEGTAPARVR